MESSTRASWTSSTPRGPSPASVSIPGQLELDVDNIDLLLAEVQHPLLRKQVLRMMLDVVNADSRLSGGEAVLVAEAMKYWEIDLYEVADNAIPSLRVRSKARFSQAHA